MGVGASVVPADWLALNSMWVAPTTDSEQKITKVKQTNERRKTKDVSL
jgi:hypothetical protein